jgi:uncharacterized iron-regulated membrane protein
MNEDITEGNVWWTKDVIDKVSREADNLARHNMPALRKKIYQLMVIGYLAPFMLSILILFAAGIFLLILRPYAYSPLGGYI